MNMVVSWFVSALVVGTVSGLLMAFVFTKELDTPLKSEE